MKKICRVCRQERAIQKFNTCADCLRKADKIKRNALKNGTLSKKKTVVDGSLVTQMKTDKFLRIAYNVISGSKTQARLLGLKDKDDMDFTIFELADRLRDTLNCEKCGVELNYSDSSDAYDIFKDYKGLDKFEAHVVHILPFSAGGKLQDANLAVFCNTCYKAKKVEENNQIK
jgi:hypothetical protein